MGHLRFWRRVRVAPGVTLNLSKSGASVSVGPRGAKLTAGRRGVRKTVGLPGTGLYYTHQAGRGRRRRRTKAGVPPERRLTLGFFRRLVTPPGERAFVDGCRALALGDPADAARHLEAAAASCPDGAFLAGVHALAERRYDDALDFFARARSPRLGSLFARYGLDADVRVAITDEVDAVLGPDARGLALATAEAHQGRGDLEAALSCVEPLRRTDPGDPVVRLSLAELLLEARPGDRDAARRVLKITGEVRNESPVHGALILLKARALRVLGLPAAARDLLGPALRRRKGRPAGLLRALRYERALAYGDLGHRGRKRADLERLFAEDPAFADVAARLGLDDGVREAG